MERKQEFENLCIYSCALKFGKTFNLWKILLDNRRQIPLKTLFETESMSNTGES